MSTMFWIRLGLMVFGWWLRKQDDNTPLVAALTEVKGVDGLLALIESEDTAEQIEHVVNTVSNRPTGETIVDFASKLFK